MSFLEDLEVAFGTADLYAVLGLEKSCGEEEIKKAYRKKALQVHPDRAPEGEKESATKKFQLLGECAASICASWASFLRGIHCLRLYVLCVCAFTHLKCALSHRPWIETMHRYCHTHKDAQTDTQHSCIHVCAHVPFLSLLGRQGAQCAERRRRPSSVRRGGGG